MWRPGSRPLVPCPGQVAACLLLFLEEEDAFWMMCAIIEDLLPASYFSTTLLGVQTDQRVLRHLIVQYLPRLDKLLQEHDIGKGGLPFLFSGAKDGPEASQKKPLVLGGGGGEVTPPVFAALVL